MPYLILVFSQSPSAPILTYGHDDDSQKHGHRVHHGHQYKDGQSRKDVVRLQKSNQKWNLSIVQ